MSESDFTELSKAHDAWQEEEDEARREAVMNRQPFYGLQIDPEIDFYPEVANRKPGDTNIVKRGFDIHPQVTLWAAGFLALFIGFTLIFKDTAADVFSEVLGYINGNFGWFYILSANVFVLAAVYFAFGRYGKIRIGGPKARPEFYSLVNTLIAAMPQILAWHTAGRPSNGRIEGTNNLLQVLRRTAHGFTRGSPRRSAWPRRPR